jgi:probable HAF family extracellular repeat protein
MSANGVVVGYISGAATRWLTPGAPETLGTPLGYHASAANGVSADGSVVVGSAAGSSTRGIVWSSAGMQLVGVLPGDSTSVAKGVSGDGLTVVGFSTNVAGNVGNAFRWSDTTGIVSLGRLPESAVAEAIAASYDGSVIVGSSANQPVAGAAVIWLDGETIPRDLNVYLPTLGIDLTGWALYSAVGVSADGRTIIGEGRFNGVVRGYVAVIPSPSALVCVLAFLGPCAIQRRRQVAPERSRTADA